MLRCKVCRLLKAAGKQHPELQEQAKQLVETWKKLVPADAAPPAQKRCQTHAICKLVCMRSKPVRCLTKAYVTFFWQQSMCPAEHVNNIRIERVWHDLRPLSKHVVSCAGQLQAQA